MPATQRVCQDCGSEFHGRADADYCSQACRQRAYRKRNATASRDVTTSRDVTGGPVPVGDAWMVNRFGSVGYEYQSAASAAAIIEAEKPRRGSADRKWLDQFVDDDRIGPRMIRSYIDAVSTIGEALDGEYDLSTPLGDALPAKLNPPSAAEMAERLAAALALAHQLLDLLDRRAREETSDTRPNVY